MRRYIVSNFNESGSKVIEFTFICSQAALEYYNKATENNDIPRELGIICGDIYNTLKENYSVSNWTPKVQKSSEVNNMFKRKSHEPY